MRLQVKMLITTVVVETHNDVSVRGASELDRRSAMSVQGQVSCFNSSSMCGNMDGRWITIGSHADAISLLYSPCYDRILLIFLYYGFVPFVLSPAAIHSSLFVLEGGVLRDD